MRRAPLLFCIDPNVQSFAGYRFVFRLWRSHLFHFQNVEQEHERRNADDQSPHPEEMLGEDQDDERVEDRQMGLRRHQARIQDVRFHRVNQHDKQKQVYDGR